MIKFKRKKQEKATGRIAVVDFLKLVSLLLMIVTHVVMFTFNQNSSGVFDKITNNISLFGGTVAFVMFLFLSGTSLYISYTKIKNKQFTHFYKKVIKRSFFLFLIYVALAIVMSFALDSTNLNNLEGTSERIVKLLVFNNMPPLVEFLFPLIVLPIIVLPVLEILKFQKDKNKWLILGLLGIGSYFLGMLIYEIPTSLEVIITIKSLLFGHGELHTFPLAQYIIVYIAGLLFGHVVQANGNDRSMLNRLAIYLFGVLNVYFIAFIISFSEFTKEFEVIINPSLYTGRFPPSIPFLALGIITILMLSMLYKAAEIILKQNKLFNYIEKSLSFVGKSLLTAYVFHVLILATFIAIANNSDLEIVSDSSLRIFIFTTLLFLTVLGIYKLITIIRKTEIFIILAKSFNERLLLISMFSFTLIITMSLLLFFSIQNKNFKIDAVERYLVTADPMSWWNNEYELRTKIDISSLENEVSLLLTNELALNYGINLNNYSAQIISIEGEIFEHKIYSNAEKSYITFSVKNVASDTSELFIYISRNSATHEPIIEEIIPTNFYELTNFEQHELSIAISNNWFLKDWTESLPTVQVDSALFYRNVLYGELVVEGTDIRIPLSSSLSSETFELSELNSLDPGTYNIQAIMVVFEDELKIYYSDIEKVHVSYPLFVIWSLDWEGMGVNNTDLTAITNIADTYGVPLVHFFNPRIYVDNQYSVPAVPPSHATYYTNWVKQRRDSKGDEIGLHIHLFPDLVAHVEKAVNIKLGLLPTTTDQTENEEPETPTTQLYKMTLNFATKIAGIGRDEYSLATFTKDDLVNIFEWSKEKFAENGLGMPLSFRSGAWMSSPNLMTALEQVGIKVDSSGRTSGLLNPSVSSSTPVTWDLSVTQKPYFPNRTNMNSSDDPQFSVLQIPNNGADSYWFSKEDLISRFDQNFQQYKSESGEMLEPQVVTYLSHPHSFAIFDTEKIQGMYAHVDQFAYRNNAGPVVYVTYEDIFYGFPIEKLTNNLSNSLQ